LLVVLLMYALASNSLRGCTVVEPPIMIDAEDWFATGVAVGAVPVGVAVGAGLVLVHPKTSALTPIIAMVSKITTNFLLYIRLFTLSAKFRQKMLNIISISYRAIYRLYKK